MLRIKDDIKVVVFQFIMCSGFFLIGFGVAHIVKSEQISDIEAKHNTEISILTEAYEAKLASKELQGVQ